MVRLKEIAMKSHVLPVGMSLVALALVLLSAPALAATLTWDADTVTAGAQDGAGTWNTALNNWHDGAGNVLWPNTTGDFTVFGAGSGPAGAVAVGAVTTGGITFNSAGSGAYVLSGGPITLQARSSTTPNITMNSDATINSPITMTGANNVNGLTLGGSGKLTFGGTVSYNGLMGLRGTSTLSITPGGSVSLTGTVGNQIIFADAGSTLSIDGGSFSSTGNNGATAGFCGNLTVNSGSFFAQSNENNASRYYSVVLVNGNTSLNLNGGTTSLQAVTTSASGANMSTLNFNGGTLRVIAQPPVSAAGTFIASHGNLTAQVQAGGAVIDTNGNNATISEPLIHDPGLAGADGGLIKNGNGALTLTSVNTYTGGTTVNQGTLLLGTGGSTGTIRGTATVNAGAILDYTAANAFGYTAGVSVNRLDILGGTVGGADVGNHFWNSFQLNMTGGTLKLGGTLNEFHNPTITVNSSSTTAQIVPVGPSAVLRLRDGTSALVNVADGSQDVDLNVSVPVTQNGSCNINKIGPGRIALVALTNSFNQLNVAAGPATLGTAGTVNTLGSIQVGNAHTSGGGSATLDIPDGSLTTGWIQLGNTPGTAITAIVNQTGGAVRTTSSPAESAGLRLGHYPASITFYNLSNGTLLIDNGQYLTCAVDGTGTFYQTGGEATATRVVVNARSGGGGNGTLNIEGGRLNVGSGGITNEGSGPATVKVGGDGGTIRATASFSSSLPMTLSGTGVDAATFDTNGNNIALSGALSGAGGLIKDGAGTLTLSGLNPYTGGTVIHDGILEVSGSSSGQCRIRGSVTVNPGAELRLTGGDGSGFGYTSSASPSQRVDTLNIVDGLVNAGNVHLYYASVNMTGGDFNVTGQFGNVAVNTLASANTAQIAGGIVIRGDSWNYLTPHLPFTVADGAAGVDLLVSANISETAGTGRISKLGAGTMVLTGTNSYSGTTTVEAGTLLVNGSNNGTGAVTVNGGVLGGTGVIAGPVTINGGGTIGAGASPGHLTLLSAYSQAELGVLHAELGGNEQGISYDWIEVGTTATLADGAIIDIDWYGGFWGHGPFDILTAANGITNVDLSGIVLDGSGASYGEHAWVASIVSLGGEAEAIRLELVPEPLTLLALGMGLTGLGGYVRRRRPA